MNNSTVSWLYDAGRNWVALPETPTSQADLHEFLTANQFEELYKVVDPSSTFQVVVWRHSDDEKAPVFSVPIPRERRRSSQEWVSVDYAVDVWKCKTVTALIYVRDFPSLLGLVQQLVCLEQFGLLRAIREVRDQGGPVFVTMPPIDGR